MQNPGEKPPRERGFMPSPSSRSGFCKGDPVTPVWAWPLSPPQPNVGPRSRLFPEISLTTRRRVLPLLCLATFALGTVALAMPARAQSALAAQVARPVSLPDIAIGSEKATVTITEYASMSCPHCAAWGENVFPMLRSRYIDTGKVRFVFREFPLDIKAAGASMLARCIAKDDAEKYLAVTATMYQQLDPLLARTKETLTLIGKLNGMSEQEVAACETDQSLLDKLKADQQYALATLKVDSTPTFFVNGQRLKGAMSFEELDAILRPMFKR
jgi:protein-disulfide isomerase